MAEVEFRVLGVVEAVIAGKPIDLGTPRQRAVLAILLVQAPKVVTADQLIHRVWGQSPPEAVRRSLASYLSRLRAALRPGSVDIPWRHGGYLLDIDPALVDMHRYQRLVQRARSAADDEQAMASWQRAVALWHGRPFGDLDVPWLDQVAEQLTGHHHAALADYRDLRLRRGEHAELVPELRAAVHAHPLDERVAAQLMLALYRDGRQADALAHYEGLQRRLADELGSDPAPTVQRLHRQILTSDTGLAAPPPAQALPDDVKQAPVTLPWDTADFTGRVSEIDRLHAYAAADHRPGTAPTAVISGSGGVGKTSLAVHWAHQTSTADRFPDGRLYVNLLGFSDHDPLTSADALRELLRQLGVPGARIPSGLDSKREAYRRRLDGRKVLVILDNAVDSDQVRPLLVGPPGLAVITSRSRLPGLAVHEGVGEITLGRLPLQDASVLAGQLLGGSHQEAATVRLSKVCARLPLAIRLAATGFRAAHPDTSLADYLDQLQDDRIGLLDAGAENQHTLTNVLSWSTRQLPGELAHAAVVIGLHPGPQVDLPAIAAMLDQPEQPSRRIVRKLANTSLLEETKPGRWAMHDLLRDHARESAAGTGVEPPTIHTRLLEHYTSRLTSQPIDHRWFIGEYQALMSCLRLPIDSEAAGRYALAFADRLLEHAYYSDARRAYEIVRQRFSPDSQAYAQSLYGLGRAGNLIGSPPEETIPHLTEARRRFASLSDPLGEARALREQSEVIRKREQYTYDLDRQALALYQQAGDSAGAAHTLAAMGRGAYTLGDYSASFSYGSQAIEAAVKSGSKREIGRAHRVRATAARHVGDYDQAAADYATALDLAVEISDRGGESMAVAELAEFCVIRGRYAEAVRYGNRAIALADELGDRTNIAIAQFRMAQIHLATHHLPRAAAMVRSAGTALREMAHVSGGAASDIISADLSLIAGEAESAAERYRRAERELTDAGYVRLAAEARYGLGRAALSLGDREEAGEHWKHAMTTLDRIGSGLAANVRHALDWLETGRGSFDVLKPLWMAR